MMIQRHFTATGVVINEKREVLLILHKKLGVWLPPGGHVEPNETPDTAVLREIFEETGVRATIAPNGEDSSMGDEWAGVLAQPMCILLEDIGMKGEHFHIDLVYRCSAQSQLGDANESEALDMGWFGEDMLEKLDMYHNARAAVIKALRVYDMENGNKN